MESRKDASAANLLHDRQHQLYKALSQTAEGREAIIALMDDPNPWVQVSAAMRSLAWEPTRADPLLETLAHDEDLPPVLSFKAKMVLDQWRAGELNPEY